MLGYMFLWTLTNILFFRNYTGCKSRQRRGHLQEHTSSYRPQSVQ
jgi:hypothetical protein